MKHIALSSLVLTSFLGFSAHAWPERRFECKNIESLPANTYDFKKVNLAGIDMAYVTVTRHYKGPLENGVVTTRTSTVKGLATESTNGDSEILILGSLRFEFTNDELFNCKAP